MTARDPSELDTGPIEAAPVATLFGRRVTTAVAVAALGKVGSAIIFAVAITVAATRIAAGYDQRIAANAQAAEALKRTSAALAERVVAVEREVEGVRREVASVRQYLCLDCVASRGREAELCESICAVDARGR